MRKNRFNQKIMQLAKDIQRITRESLTVYGQEVDGIISLGCRDKQRIDHALDGMISFCSDKKMLALYKKLCRYYYGFDQTAAAEYMLIYRDMWETEDA